MNTRELVDKDLREMRFYRKYGGGYYVDVIAILHFLNVICSQTSLPRECFIEMGKKARVTRIDTLCGDYVELDMGIKWRSKLRSDRDGAREVLGISVNRLGHIVIKVD